VKESTLPSLHFLTLIASNDFFFMQKFPTSGLFGGPYIAGSGNSVLLIQTRRIGQNCSSSLANINKLATAPACFEPWAPSSSIGGTPLLQYTDVASTRFTLTECAAACSASSPDACGGFAMADTPAGGMPPSAWTAGFDSLGALQTLFPPKSFPILPANFHPTMLEIPKQTNAQDILLAPKLCFLAPRPPPPGPGCAAGCTALAGVSAWRRGTCPAAAAARCVAPGEATAPLRPIGANGTAAPAPAGRDGGAWLFSPAWPAAPAAGGGYIARVDRDGVDSDGLAGAGWLGPDTRAVILRVLLRAPLLARARGGGGGLARAELRCDVGAGGAWECRARVDAAGVGGAAGDGLAAEAAVLALFVLWAVAHR
jgi:hypothetical protein